VINVIVAWKSAILAKVCYIGESSFREFQEIISEPIGVSDLSIGR
jgi:hypothetical protein